ncbi:MAG: Holliday junction resolvase RuvX [Clostridia bacterium]|nr:Holliday junction resolvase RuvX [Clostridia bacterium]
MERLIQCKGKLLGVDFGDKRTGLAVSDRTQFLASGIGYISPGGLEKTAEAVGACAKEQGVCAIVVGLPVNMNGSEGFRAERVRRFIAQLEEQTQLPVVPFDERLSTMEAGRYLNESDTRGQKRKQVIDTLSAQIILQSALDRLRFLRSQSSG